MTIRRFVKFVMLAVLCSVTANSFLFAQDRCGTNASQQYYLDKYPGLAAKLHQVYADAQAYAAAHAGKKPLLVTIPVVVHVITNGEAYGVGANITDEQIFSQIEVLNEDYRRLNADTSNTPSVFKPIAADVEVEFCMAIRDPNGQFTNGITRYDGGQATWTRDNFDQFVKPVTTWPRDQYLNIWTTKLGGADASVLGYAIKPGNPADIDGVVIVYTNFGRIGNVVAPYDLGRTTVHEVGHWLGLDHTWGLGEPSVSNCSDDDFVNDTPVQDKANYGCPTFPHISCSNGPNGDMYMNYMDYTNDDCQNIFTEGQKTLMQSILNTSRVSILSSEACTHYTDDVGLIDVVHPVDTICVNTFIPVVAIRNEGSIPLTQVFVNYTIDGTGFTQQQWNGNLQPGDTAYVPINSVTLQAGSYLMEVFLTNPNGQQDGNNLNNIDTVNLVVENGSAVGLGIPISEGFESATFPPGLWTSNAASANDWNRTLLASNEGIASALVSFYTETTPNVKYSLYSPTLQVFGPEYPVMTFDYAYAQIDANSSDSLKLYYSLDCGRNWTLIWSKGGAGLATANMETNSFVPADASAWRQGFGFAPGAASQNQIRFRFDAIYGGGNNIYLDNINIGTYALGIEDKPLTEDLSVFPNPATNSITVKASSTGVESLDLVIYNAMGQKLLSRRINGVGAVNEQIDLSALQPGLYLVGLSSGSRTSFQKLVIQ